MGVMLHIESQIPHFCKAFLLFWFPFSSESLYFTLSFFPPLLEAAVWALNSLADGPQGWLLESLDYKNLLLFSYSFQQFKLFGPFDPWQNMKGAQI